MLCHLDSSSFLTRFDHHGWTRKSERLWRQHHTLLVTKKKKFPIIFLESQSEAGRRHLFRTVYFSSLQCLKAKEKGYPDVVVNSPIGFPIENPVPYFWLLNSFLWHTLSRRIKPSRFLFLEAGPRLGFPRGNFLPIRHDIRDGIWQCLYDYGTENPRKYPRKYHVKWNF